MAIAAVADTMTRIQHAAYRNLWKGDRDLEPAFQSLGGDFMVGLSVNL